TSFQPYKAPGPDGLFPALLQAGLELCLTRLCRMFRASIALGYIPKTWRTVDVRFIPKAGRNTYDRPKDYRPISLMSFMLKVLEKLIDRWLRENILLSSPLHARQFAYQKGKSTEHALLGLASVAQKALDDGELALAAFLDISGAFDNASYRSMTQALERRNTDACCVRWIASMLECRKITTSICGTTKKIYPAKGCPQGGVLSPLLWNLVVDDLLRKLDDFGVFSQG